IVVMLPLAEILPDFELGEHGRAADLAQALGGQGIRLLKE
ncbi:2-amino-4-hydroxy-6-hydroxymethyldihydropteridine diphosphokinase, partial [Neisseria sp. P0021.S006]